MPDFTPTPEQTAIVEAAATTPDNLAVVARAGAAKTSTLVLIAEALPTTDILCLAFNKKIALEMTERLPPNCEAKTLHALGYKAWWQFTGKKMKLNGRKVYQLLRQHAENLTPEDRDEFFSAFSETLDFIGKGKQQGWLPEDYRGHWRPLITDEEFFGGLPMEPTHLHERLIREVSRDSFKAALTGDLDFDDMIFCPAICSVSWPKPTLTLVDEAQDLSPINHHILKKLVKNRRLIAVGDPCQAIYGFRGADAHSMTNMIQKFDMTELRLTVSFRCGSRIIENARWRAPDMQSPDWAEPGEVLRPAVWAAEDIQLGDAIICRNNAPLFSMAIKMIEEDLLPEIAGRDIAAPLVKIMKKLGKPGLLSPAASAALGEWEEAELRRARNGAKGLIRDKAAVIEMMLAKTTTLGDAIAYLNHLLERDGRVHLMTGHKSKGLEFDRVWFLDSHLCRTEHDQDANIKYVIETRAKKQLAYVRSDSFVGGLEDE